MNYSKIHSNHAHYAANTKALIIASGYKLGVLATQAKISQSNLSNHISGSRCNHKTQLKIWDAFRVLSGSKISLEQFWGARLSQRLASHDTEHGTCTDTTTLRKAKRA